MVFVDTSAFYAFFDVNDQNHANAKRIWTELIDKDTPLFSTNYVLIETAALIQNRLGINPLRAFHEDVSPFLHVIWVDAALHTEGMTILLTAGRRQLSLVDCVSFAAMHHSLHNDVFTYDKHFAEQGFNVVQ